MFIGGNKKKVNLPQCQYFEEGNKISIDIRAVIYVPDRLITGICFPKGIEIENEYPHLTLMISEGWNAVLSNAVIETTCGKGMPFYDAYIDASKNILPAKNAGVISAHNVDIDKKGKNEVVFVLLREPVSFDGQTKCFN